MWGIVRTHLSLKSFCSGYRVAQSRWHGAGLVCTRFGMFYMTTHIYLCSLLRCLSASLSFPSACKRSDRIGLVYLMTPSSNTSLSRFLRPITKVSSNTQLRHAGFTSVANFCPNASTYTTGSDVP